MARWRSEAGLADADEGDRLAEDVRRDATDRGARRVSGRAVDLPVEDRATAPGAAARNAAVLRPVDRIGRVDRVDPVGLGAAADPEVAIEIYLLISSGDCWKMGRTPRSFRW